MCFLPTPPVRCPICQKIVELYPEPDQLRQRMCHHWVGIVPATGTLTATRDLGVAALNVARAMGWPVETRRWERPAPIMETANGH